MTERRTRLAFRHHLLPETRTSVRMVAGDLVGLHGTDPPTVYLSAAARMDQPGLAVVEQALYEDRLLVRMSGMRSTLFVLPIDLAPVVYHSCAAPDAGHKRQSIVCSIGRAGIADDSAGWLTDMEKVVLELLAETGGATAAELAALEPRLDVRVPIAVTKTRTAWSSLTVRLLLLLAAEGRVVRGRPQGSWTSGTYRWRRIEDWLPDGIAGSSADARAELVRRWLATYGPGMTVDLKWWTGWPMREVRQALVRAGACEVAIEAGTAYVLPEDVNPVPAAEPWVALLPALDPTVMGWRERDWYLAGLRPLLFDSNGNAGPTVWCDGRVVGGWAQRRSGEVVVRLVEDIGAEAEAAVFHDAERVTTLLGDARFTPRFRTPLERELTR